MRTILGLSSALALLALAPASHAQYAPPRGSYERQCTNIRMNGQFLSAVCRGAHGGGQSSINILSCSTDIGVDPSGALSCLGPGGGAPPPAYPDARRPYAAEPEQPGYRSPDRRGGWDRGYRGASVTLFAGRGWRGEPVRIDGPVRNLDSTGLNDRVGSIRLDPGSPPWIVCSDADYRGRCATVWQSVGDTRQIGLRGSISSLRPAR